MARPYPVWCLVLAIVTAFPVLSEGAPVECDAWSPGGDTHLEVTIDEPLPGSRVRAWEPGCPGTVKVRGSASTVGIPPLFDIVISIDTSGSAGGCSGADVDGDGRVGFPVGPYSCSDPQDSVLYAEAEAVRKFVRSLSSQNSRVAIIDFADLQFGGVWVRAHLTNDFQEIEWALDSLEAAGPLGATDYGAAVDLQNLEYDTYGDPAREWHALFLSDGVPTAPQPPFSDEDPEDDAAAIQATQAAAQRGIVMDTFAVGTEASQTILPLMASITGGNFYSIVDPGDILDVLPGTSLVGVESLTVTNLANGVTVPDSLNPEGRYDVDLPVVSGLNDIRVHAVADDDPPTSLDCLTDFTLECLSLLCPANRIVECEDGGGAVTGFAASVNDPLVALTNDSPWDGTAPPGDGDASGTYPMGTTTVTFTGSDAEAGNRSCTRTVTVRDIAPPVLDCPDPVTVSAGPDCTATLDLDADADDACEGAGGVQVTSDEPPSYPLGTTVVTFQATDGAGNVATCQTSVTVVDATAPEVECFPPPPSQADDQCQACPSFSAYTEDNCTPWQQLQKTQDPGCPFGLGTTASVLTVTDGAGNTATCEWLVVVTDATAPLLDCPPDQVLQTEPDDTDCEVPYDPQAAADDNCDPVVDVTDDAPAEFPLGPTTVHFTASDDSGNSSACAQQVTVLDATPPVIQCPADIQAGTGPGDTDCAVEIALSAQAADNCDASVSVTDDAPPSFPVGATVVTFTATDDAGLSSSCQTTVTVADTTPPVLACPADLTVQTGPADDDCLVPVALPASATDNCDGAVSATSNAPPLFPEGTTVVTFTATDSAGNTAACQTSVTVVDNTPPVIACPPDLTVETGPGDTDCLVPAALSATATDNCDDSPDVTSNAPALYPLGTTTVTFTATDEEGNTASCQTVVTVIDTTPPVLTCGPPVTLETGPGDTDCLVPYVPVATATDNCSAPSEIALVSDAPAEFPLGTTIVTFTATDESGNSSTCQTTVTVVDTTPPVLICQASVLLETGPADTDCLVPFVPVATATDNCSAPSEIALLSDAPAEFPLGTTIVTFTATDAAGNASVCLTEVTVTDTTPPVLELLLGPDLCLWPPNHRFYCWEDDELCRVTDNCDAAPDTALLCLPDPPGNASNQPVDSTGDGAFVPDCVIALDGFSGACVRSERKGDVPGHGEREYRIGIRAEDEAGNVTAADFGVFVGHDRKQKPACLFMDPDGGYGAEDGTLPPIYPQFRLPGSPGQRKHDPAGP